MSHVVTHQQKRTHAVTGDLVTFSHPTSPLASPFSSHADVVFAGITHQVLSLKGRGGIDFTHTTGEFSVNGMRGYVLEMIDTVETQGSHRYQAVVDSPTGVLTTYSYLGSSELLAMVGALQPVATSLGMVITPDDSVEVVSAAKVAFTTPHGLIEASPLTTDVNDLLPRWQGSPVASGELFAGHLGNDAPYLTLVTATARVLLMINSADGVDQAASFMSELEVHWAT